MRISIIFILKRFKINNNSFYIILVRISINSISLTINNNLIKNQYKINLI